MQSDRSERCVPSFSIEYSTTRTTGPFAYPAKLPRGLPSISKALKRAATHRGFRGVVIPPSTPLRSVIRNAKGGGLENGSADDLKRLLFNLGVLIRVQNYPNEEGVIVFDAELMTRLVQGESIPSAPSEQALIQRAAELMGSTGNEGAPSSGSDDPVKVGLTMEEIAEAFIDASGPAKLADGGVIDDVVHEPLKVLRAKYPGLPFEVLASYVLQAKSPDGGCLEKIGDDVWRVTLRDSSSESPPSVSDALELLYEQRRALERELEEIRDRRRCEREQEQKELNGQLESEAERDRQSLDSAYEEALSRLRADKDGRERELIEEARRTFELRVAQIKREEAERLESDETETEEDFRRRREQMEQMISEREKGKRAYFSTEQGVKDQKAFSELKGELDRLSQRIRTMEEMKTLPSKASK